MEHLIKLNRNECYCILWLATNYDTMTTFDYPDYGGIPKVIHSTFTTDFVDLIQGLLCPLEQSTTKRKEETKSRLKYLSSRIKANKKIFSYSFFI